MTEETAETASINLVRMDDGRWRVFINEEDMGAAYQFPWDALQCALNGALTEKPLREIQSIEIKVTNHTDQHRLARIRAAQAERRALLAALRGIDGEGI
jgi:hypothetical protein